MPTTTSAPREATPAPILALSIVLGVGALIFCALTLGILPAIIGVTVLPAIVLYADHRSARRTT